MRPRCRNCRFSIPWNDPNGVCRLHPPAMRFVQVVDDGINKGEQKQCNFPPIHLDVMWCGQYRRRWFGWLKVFATLFGALQTKRA